MRPGEALVVVVAVATSACLTPHPTTTPGGRRADSSRVQSNIVRADYAGSAACASCHGQIFEAWRSSPMHLMTREPEGATIRAPFDGRTLELGGDVARLEERDGARFMKLTSATFGDHLYRVTRVIGGHHREDFAGVEVTAATATTGAKPGSYRPGAELVLPVSFVFETSSLRLKGYSVMVGERPGLRAGGVWTETCVFCHNTLPYFDDTWGELHGPGAPGYQGEVVDRLLPPERRFAFAVTDEARLTEALARETRFIGGTLGDGPARAQLRDGIRQMRGRLGAEHFVELGIGCEACHGGSREHVAEPRVLPDFAPRSPFLEARPPVGWGEVTRAQWINRTCARCHQVLFSRYPYTWEGGHRQGPDAGGSSMTSGEARDFLLGGCARAMSCATCHDPHGEDRPETLASLAGAAGNALCTRCHEQFGTPEALRAHAHHDPAGAGGGCVACHMPRKNLGLGYQLTRYHRIGSPNDPARVERDRPLECALCHVDKSVGALVGAMEAWWGRRYDRAALRALYGELGALPLEATLARGKAHEQGTAVAVLGERRVRAAAPDLARQLTNPYPLVRHWAARALEQVRGAPCDVDLNRPTPELRAAAERCVPGAFPGATPTPVPGKAQAPRATEPDED